MASGQIAAQVIDPLPLAIVSPTALDQAIAAAGAMAWVERADELAAKLARAKSAEAAAELAYELGEVNERFLDDDEGSAAAYAQAFQADPSLRAGLWALRRALYRRKDYGALLPVIDAEIQVATSDAERADLYVEKGHLLWERLDDSDGARIAYEGAVELAPGSPAAVHALMMLERMSLASADDDALVVLWMQLAEAAATPGRKLAYLLDVAALQAQRGYFDEAWETLAKARSLGVASAQVARQSQRVAELIGDASGVVDAIESQIAALTARYGGQGEDQGREAGEQETALPVWVRSQIVSFRREQARALRQGPSAEEPETADAVLRYLQAAADVAPPEDLPLILADLTDAFEALGRFDELAELYQRWYEVDSDDSARAALLLRRADALLRAGKRQEAHEILTAVEEVSPEPLGAQLLRERDAVRTGDFRALAEVYQAAAQAAHQGADEGTRGSQHWAALCYVSAAQLYLDHVQDAEAAGTCLARALALVPGEPTALAALVELYERSGQLEAAAELLEEEVPRAGADERYRLLGRLCRLYRDLGNMPGYVGILRRQLEDEPESIVLRFRIESALELMNEHKERASVLVDLAGRLDSPAGRGAALQQAARLYDEVLGEPERAAELYREVLALWPGNRYASAALSALLRRAGRWEDLVRQRRDEAIELGDGPELARALREAASVLAHKLNRPAEAAALYRSLLERIPGHPGALRSLAMLLSQGEPSSELVDLLVQESTADDAPESPESTLGSTAGRALATMRLALVYEEMGGASRDDALEAYRRAAELGSRLAPLGQAELALQSEDPAARAAGLMALADSSADEELMSELLEDAGWLWALGAKDYDRALEAFERAASLTPERPGPRLGAHLVYSQAGDVRAAGDALALFAAVTAPEVAAPLLMRAAAIAEIDASSASAEKVQDRLYQALNRAPGNVATLLLAADYAASATPEEAHALTPDQLAGRADLFAVRAQLAVSPSARDDWELERAEALERAGKLQAAAQCAAAVLAQSPGDIRALQLVRRLCMRGGDYAGLARASLALAKCMSSPESKLQLLREAAAILDETLGDVASAAAVYRLILSEDPGAEEYHRLAEICRAHDDIRPLFEILCDRINWLDIQSGEGTADAWDKTPLLFERAELRQRVGDTSGASRDLAALLDIDESHAGALRMQAELKVSLQEPSAAAQLYERYLAVEEDPQRRAEAELALSQILAEEMDDVAGAIEQLENVVAQSPQDIEVRERLIRLLTRAAAWSRVLAELRAIAELRSSPQERAKDELRIAALCRDRLHDNAMAQDALLRARELEPLSLDALRQLADLHSGDAEERRRVLTAGARDVRAAIVRTPSESALYERLAAIYSWQQDRDGRYYALSATEALGSISAESKQFVVLQGRALSQMPLPRTPLSASDWDTKISAVGAVPGADIADRVWKLVSEAVSKTIGFEPGKLGFSRGEKVSPRALAKQHEPLAAIAQCFLGVDAAEYYVSPTKPGYARVLSLGKPVLCVGSDVANAETTAARFLAGRALAWARESTGSLGDLRESEIRLFFAAAAQVAGVSELPGVLAEIAASDPEGVAERARGLGKHLDRRQRKDLAQLAGSMREMCDPAQWRLAALATGARAGLLMAGDVSAAMDILDLQHGRSLASDPMAMDLLPWMVSGYHLSLRRQLGMTTLE